MKSFVVLFSSIGVFVQCGIRVELDDIYMHPTPSNKVKTRLSYNNERTASFWERNGQHTLREKLNTSPNTNIAKNVILFLGDGMSIPTLAATRVYLGDENRVLSFEQFPYTALSKTYCVNSQVADSACSATAYLCGVKCNIATIGVTVAVEVNDCDAMANKDNHVYSIAKWSQEAGKRTGIVTTSTITDASPTGTYGHTANRRWQDDTSVKKAGKNVTKCPDIAHQLIKHEVGQSFNVILGGGSNVFLPKGTVDKLGSKGTRSDGRNLIEDWLHDKRSEGHNAQYIWNRTGLLNLDEDTDYVLGLFSESYMPFNLDRNTTLTPSLEEMTEAAINIVRRGNGADDGYFLFIEGGRIDQAHHAALTKKALDETVEFAKAIQKALELTDEEDTLIVVTADHSHTLSIAGYPKRNNDILGSAGKDLNGNLRLTLSYANGPGVKECGHNYTKDNTRDKEYKFPGIFNLTSETHGGDDVAIFAKGPWAHLYSGVIEENVIPYILAYASCVGYGLTACTEDILYSQKARRKLNPTRVQHMHSPRVVNSVEHVFKPVIKRHPNGMAHIVPMPRRVQYQPPQAWMQLYVQHSYLGPGLRTFEFNGARNKLSSIGSYLGPSRGRRLG